MSEKKRENSDKVTSITAEVVNRTRFIFGLHSDSGNWLIRLASHWGSVKPITKISSNCHQTDSNS